MSMRLITGIKAGFTEVFQVLHWLHSPSITTIITTKYTDSISAASLKYKIYVYETKNWDKGGIHRGFSCFAPNILSLYNHHNHAKIYKQCQCSILKDNVYNVYGTKNWVKGGIHIGFPCFASNTSTHQVSSISAIFMFTSGNEDELLFCHCKC